MNQLDLENIDINEFMFNKLSKILEDEKYIEKYKISNINDDLFNEKKINFHYILLKYILKNSIFIYQFKLFFKTHIFIIKNLRKIKLEEENELKDKIDFVIEHYVDLKFYRNIKEKEENGKNEKNEDNEKEGENEKGEEENDKKEEKEKNEKNEENENNEKKEKNEKNENNEEKKTEEQKMKEKRK